MILMLWLKCYARSFTFGWSKTWLFDLDFDKKLYVDLWPSLVIKSRSYTLIFDNPIYILWLFNIVRAMSKMKAVKPFRIEYRQVVEKVKKNHFRINPSYRLCTQLNCEQFVRLMKWIWLHVRSYNRIINSQKSRSMARFTHIHSVEMSCWFSFLLSFLSMEQRYLLLHVCHLL